MTKSQPNSVVLDGNGGFEYKEQPYKKGIMYKNGDFTHFIDDSIKISDLRKKIVSSINLISTDELNLEEIYEELLAENIIEQRFEIETLINWIEIYTSFKVIENSEGILVIVRRKDDSISIES